MTQKTRRSKTILALALGSLVDRWRIAFVRQSIMRLMGSGDVPFETVLFLH